MRGLVYTTGQPLSTLSLGHSDAQEEEEAEGGGIKMLESLLT